MVGRGDRVRSILVVEDNEYVVKSLERFFSRTDSTVIVSRSLTEARSVLESDRKITGMILDLGLPDGSGLDLLEETSSLEPRIPTMILSGDWSEEMVRRAQAFGAVFVPKPASAENLHAFLEWAHGTAAARAALHRELSNLTTRHGLTPREAEIVRLSARGLSRSEIIEHLGIGDNTLKTLIRRMLRKAQKSGLHEMRSELLARIFAEESESDDDGERGDGEPSH
jgi:DNA-binding NarL/FixJ family response regulator